MSERAEFVTPKQAGTQLGATESLLKELIFSCELGEMDQTLDFGGYAESADEEGDSTQAEGDE
jgi:hypothetical protein